jgi:hypothetical protein
LGGSFALIVELFDVVEVGFGDGSVEAHADGASDGRAESGEDHVASGDGLDGGADVGAHLLISADVVHLRHFFRRFKTAGERPIYKLHGDPFAICAIFWGDGWRAGTLRVRCRQ